MDGSSPDIGAPSADGTSASNPRAAQVRIEAVAASSVGGQRAHDLRLGPQPSYVDADRTHLNRVLISPWTGTELRRESEHRRERRQTRRAMKRNAGVGVRGIVTFGHEAQVLFRRLSPEEQDTAYRELAEAIAQKLGTTLTGLVVHCDESAPHAHLQMVGYDEAGTPISQVAKRGSLRELQDLTAEVMARHCPGVERGHSKIDRLRGGARPADVVHWSVAELHDRLPAQIAELRARIHELEGAHADAEEKARKNEGLAQKAIAKAHAAKTADDERARKAQRNLEAYERRAEAVRADAGRLAQEMGEARGQLARLQARANADLEALTGLEADLGAQKAELVERGHDLDARRAEIAAAETRRDALREDIATLEGRVAKLRDREELNAREEKRLRTYEGRLATKQAELDASAREIEREKKTALAVRNDAESDAQALRDDARALRDHARDHARAIREEAANEIADRKAALDTRASGIDAALAEVGRLREAARRDAARIRADAEADAEAATAQGRADVAARERDCARIENAASNLVRSATAAVEGRHDEEVTHEQVSDPVELATLREHAPDHRPTRGFLYRFWSLNDPRTGAPLSLPGAVRAALERAFDTVARAARWATALARDRAAWEAGRPARDAALAEVGAAEGRLVEIGKREAQAAEAARRALQERDEALGARDAAEDAARSILDQARAEAAETRQAAARSVREELRGAIDAVAADPEKIEADNGPHLAAVRRWFEEHGRGLRERARHEADAERTRLLAAARAEADALRPDPAALAAQAAAMASEVAARRLQEAELIAHVATAGLVPVLRAQGVDPGTCDALEWRYEGRKDLQDRFWSNPARPVRPVVQAARTAAAEMTEMAGSPRQRFERLAGAAVRLGEAVRAAFADDPDERTAVGLSVLEALGRARGARDEKGYPHQPAAFVEFHPAYEALRKEARAQLAHAERVHQLTRPEARRDGLGPAP